MCQDELGQGNRIACLYQMAIRTLQIERKNPDDVRVLSLAPTGTAAYTVSGITIHSVFLKEPLPQDEDQEQPEDVGDINAGDQANDGRRFRNFITRTYFSA